MISEKHSDVIEDDRYALLGIIGRGTWGTVYRAMDSVTDGEVAIKVLTPTALAEEQMKERNITPFKAMQKEGVWLLRDMFCQE